LQCTYYSNLIYSSDFDLDLFLCRKYNIAALLIGITQREIIISYQNKFTIVSICRQSAIVYSSSMETWLLSSFVLGRETLLFGNIITTGNKHVRPLTWYVTLRTSRFTADSREIFIAKIMLEYPWKYPWLYFFNINKKVHQFF